jgi:hypothetical protein
MTRGSGYSRDPDRPATVLSCVWLRWTISELAKASSVDIQLMGR